MQTSELVLLLSRFTGFVMQPMQTLVKLVEDGHFEAASGIAPMVLANVEKFQTQLTQLPVKRDEDVAKTLAGLDEALRDMRGRLDKLEAPKP